MERGGKTGIFSGLKKGTGIVEKDFTTPVVQNPPFCRQKTVNRRGGRGG